MSRHDNDDQGLKPAGSYAIPLDGSSPEAIKKAKATSFYKHCGFKGATSHIDDKYGVDVDDIHEIEDILSPQFKEKFQLKISKSEFNQGDVLEIGYVKIEKLLKDGQK